MEGGGGRILSGSHNLPKVRLSSPAVTEWQDCPYDAAGQPWSLTYCWEKGGADVVSAGPAQQAVYSLNQDLPDSAFPFCTVSLHLA